MRRVLLLGATGTAGRATAQALVAAGHEVVAFVRAEANTDGLPSTVLLRFGRVRDSAALRDVGVAGERFDAIVSCLTSRTGAPEDAWAIDHKAQLGALRVAQECGIQQFVLLSAICVQKPRLAFQHAKLAFEKDLMASGLTWSIVRPTAFFKSLGGQIARIQNGKPYLMFGDGTLTACKPISDRDLGRFIAGCVANPRAANRVLPIGGPGPALTPKDMGAEIFRLTGQKPKYKRVPVAMMTAIVKALAFAGKFSPKAAKRAEFARTGHYYATESMLVWNAEVGRYDAEATPEFGSDHLFDFYARVIDGSETVDLGDHAVF